jgi:hypothetical protein
VLQQIVPHKFSTPLFGFCETTLNLVEREARARKELRPGDNGARAASFANGILKLVKRRHKHISRCPKCLVAESLMRR